jgi:hypothetical protein
MTTARHLSLVRTDHRGERQKRYRQRQRVAVYPCASVLTRLDPAAAPTSYLVMSTICPKRIFHVSHLMSLSGVKRT